MRMHQTHIGFQNRLDTERLIISTANTATLPAKSFEKVYPTGIVSYTNKTLFQCLCSENKCDLNILSGALRTIRLRRVSTRGCRIQLHTFPTSSAPATKTSLLYSSQYYQAPKYNTKCSLHFARAL